MKNGITIPGLPGPTVFRRATAIATNEASNYKRSPYISNSTRPPALGTTEKYITVIGTAAIDWISTPKHLILNDQAVSLQGPNSWEVIPYHPARMHLGETRTAAVDIEPVAQRLGAQPAIGGGNYNVARELDRLRKARALPYEIQLIDTGTHTQDKKEETDRINSEYTALNLARSSANLILMDHVEGAPRRTILRSAAVAPVALNGEWHRAIAGKDLKVVIIHAPNADDIAAAAVEAALRSSAYLITTLKPSTTLDCRLRTQLGNSNLTVANLSNFRDLLAPLEIECPDREHFTSAPGIADAIADLTGLTASGDIIVTIGEAGQVVYDSSKGIIVHIGLTEESRALCRTYLPAMRCGGIGDAAVANLAVTINYPSPASPKAPDLILAARSAWMELLAGSNARFLHPQEGWFTVRILRANLPTAAKGKRSGRTWEFST